MAAPSAYIAQLEASAQHYREVNDRIVTSWLPVLGDDPDVDSEVSRVLGRNRHMVDCYSQQALWHRNDNGEKVVCWPQEKVWSD